MAKRKPQQEPSEGVGGVGFTGESESTQQEAEGEAFKARAWRSDQEIAVRIVGAEKMEPKFVTTFAIGYLRPDEWVLTLACASPLGVLTAEEWATIQVVEALPVGRFVLTLPHAEMLIDVLAGTFNQAMGRQVYRKEVPSS